MPTLSRLLSLLAAGSMMVSGTLHTAAPQHDVDGLLFLVNRQYRGSEAYEPDDLEMSDVPGQVRKMRPAAASRSWRPALPSTTTTTRRPERFAVRTIDEPDAAV